MNAHLQCVILNVSLCITFCACNSHCCNMLHVGAIGYRLKSQLKRYWAVDLWRTLFETLLQPGKPEAAPSYKHLLDLFHQHLSANPAAANKLRSELVKQDHTF